MTDHAPLALFLALVGLYSPVAALASYLPIVRPFTDRQLVGLATGLVLNATAFVLVAIWVGEPLLELLGISTAALTATGGIALAYAAIPLMRGEAGTAAEPDAAPAEPGRTAPAAADDAERPAPDPRAVLFTPITFPLTVGGTTFAFGVAASAGASGAPDRLLLSLAAVGYAIVTGVTLYLAGHVERRISLASAVLLDRLAGILLTSIAVTLLANGFTDLVRARLGT
jgi:multiple antibiotic resistance protein